MPRVTLAFAIATAAIALAGCNETNGSAGPVLSAPIVASAYTLPAGAPCTREIEEYDGVVAHDLTTGNVEQSVADKIHAELRRAAAACGAGNAAQSHAIVTGSKVAHGYRA